MDIAQTATDFANVRHKTRGTRTLCQTTIAHAIRIKTKQVYVSVSLTIQKMTYFSAGILFCQSRMLLTMRQAISTQ